MKINFDEKQNILTRIHFWKDENNNDDANIHYIEKYKDDFLFEKITYHVDNAKDGIFYIDYFKKGYKYPYKFVGYRYYYDETHKDIHIIRYDTKDGYVLKKELYKDNKVISTYIRENLTEEELKELKELENE